MFRLPHLLPVRRPANWLGCGGLTGLFTGHCLLALGQAAPAPSSVLHDWGAFIQTYHRAPDPRLLAKTLAYARATTPADQQRLLGNQGGLLGFYQTWLAAHPEARADFRRELGQLGGPASWQRFLLTLTAPADPTRPPGQGPSPAHNDYLWGAFFATGQPRYLDSLVAQCRLLVVRPADARQRQLFYTTGWSAGWSLKSNGDQDSTVAAYLRTPQVRQRLEAIGNQYRQANQE